jgi:hypothetical protein
MDDSKMIVRLLVMLVIMTTCGVSVMLGAASFFAVQMFGG